MGDNQAGSKSPPGARHHPWKGEHQTVATGIFPRLNFTKQFDLYEQTLPPSGHRPIARHCKDI